MILVRVGHHTSLSKRQKNLARKSPTKGRILAGCFWTWTLPRQYAPILHHFHHVHCRLYTRDGAKKTERTSDVAVFLLCRHNGGWPANLPRWPVKVVYQATMEIGTCCVTSEDLRGATSSGTGSGRESLAAPGTPRRPDTHGTLFLFLFLFFSFLLRLHNLEDQWFGGLGFGPENKDLG